MSTTDAHNGLPTVSIDEPDNVSALVRRLQAFVLKHPFAAQAAFSALVAEGEAFAATPEGAAWRDRLVESELVHRARFALDLPGLSLLMRAGIAATPPSSFVDALFTLASSRKPDEILDDLLSAGPPFDDH